MNLIDRRAIITGAGQGLGAEIARLYVEAGASVMLCSRTSGDVEGVCARLSSSLKKGQEVEGHVCDVADPVQVDGLIAAAIQAFGKIDILVNNAGIYGPIGLLDTVEWEDWVEAIRINLLGTVYPCRAILPHFRKNRYGKIINLSGGGATNPLPHLSAYAASKAAVVRFTETLAIEVSEFGIDVNAVAPGALATRLTDQLIEAGPKRAGADLHRRMTAVRESGGTPLEKGAGLCEYLASAKSDGITGRLISAVWDPWPELQDHRSDLNNTDIYTLRRIVPKDRGLSWGDH